MVPIIFCFYYFQFLEQELRFDYDSSSSFLTLNMKCISYFIYVQIICISLKSFIFVTFFPVTFFPVIFFRDFISVTFFPVTFFPSTHHAYAIDTSQIRKIRRTYVKVTRQGNRYVRVANQEYELRIYDVRAMLLSYELRMCDVCTAYWTCHVRATHFRGSGWGIMINE